MGNGCSVEQAPETPRPHAIETVQGPQKVAPPVEQPIVVVFNITAPPEPEKKEPAVLVSALKDHTPREEVNGHSGKIVRIDAPETREESEQAGSTTDLIGLDNSTNDQCAGSSQGMLSAESSMTGFLSQESSFANPGVETWESSVDAEKNKHLVALPGHAGNRPEVVVKQDGSRILTIAHFNDVYNIEPASRDPVGGAARLATKVVEIQHTNPLVLFSGDCFNPSLMSTITLGKQMVPVLNELNVAASCMGNHDFDYGTDNLLKLTRQCNFPWLMANVRDKVSGEPYAEAGSTFVINWNGVKVGMVGLVEDGWLETLGAVNLGDLEYEDFVTVGRKLAQQLKAEGCELVVALTHMREPNDRKLAAEVPEFHLVLGGHDHHYVVDYIEPHMNLMVKSGTDFRDLTELTVKMKDDGPEITYTRHPITSALSEHPPVKDIVEEYMAIMGAKMDGMLGRTLTDLDGRFSTVRRAESNLGNFVCDVWRKVSDAEICILNGGSLRSDQIHPAGNLKVRDFVNILPMIDETVILEATGAQVVRALENGVSAWPTLEGRFPQVSGIRFAFDPEQPKGSRIVSGSVMFTGSKHRRMEPLDMERKYTLAVKDYLSKGKDGFDVFLECKMLVDSESAPIIPSAIKNHFTQLRVASMWKRTTSKGIATQMGRKWKYSVLKKVSSNLSFEDLHAEANKDSSTCYISDRLGMLSRFGSPELLAEVFRCNGTGVQDPEKGVLAISPIVEGRIVNIREPPPSTLQPTAAA